MAEGTRFSKLEAATIDLQKTQGMMDDKLTLVDSRLGTLEEMLHRYKESFENMQQMMRGLLQTRTVENTPNLGTRNIQADIRGAGIFSGRGLKVEVPRFDGTGAEDWVFKIKEFFNIDGVPKEQQIKIA